MTKLWNGFPLPPARPWHVVPAYLLGMGICSAVAWGLMKCWAYYQPALLRSNIPWWLYAVMAVLAATCVWMMYRALSSFFLLRQEHATGYVLVMFVVLMVQTVFLMEVFMRWQGHLLKSKRLPEDAQFDYYQNFEFQLAWEHAEPYVDWVLEKEDKYSYSVWHHTTVVPARRTIGNRKQPAHRTAVYVVFQHVYWPDEREPKWFAGMDNYAFEQAALGLSQSAQYNSPTYYEVLWQESELRYVRHSELQNDKRPTVFLSPIYTPFSKRAQVATQQFWIAAATGLGLVLLMLLAQSYMGWLRSIGWW